MWLTLRPTDRGVTYIYPQCWARLDVIYDSPQNRLNLQRVYIERLNLSDHAIIVAKINTNIVIHFCLPVWRCNKQIFKNPDYIPACPLFVAPQLVKFNIELICKVGRFNSKEPLNLKL